MSRCDMCGNEYKNPIEVKIRGKTHTFDCFECAIEMLAPKCITCGVQILGHGVEECGLLYCSQHCFREHEKFDRSFYGIGRDHLLT